MDKANYYTIYTDKIDMECLLEGDDVYLIQHEIKDILKKTSTQGRLQIEPKKIDMISELDGEYEHYSKEEIDNAAEISIPEVVENIGGGLYMVCETILSTLEESGIKSFKAYPIYLSHKDTQRVWRNYWYVIFTYAQHIPLLTGKELCFYAEFEVYFSESVIKNLKKTNVKNLTFQKHEFSLCQSVLLSSIDNVSEQVIKEIEQLFIHKKPRATKDSAYSINFFLIKLKEKYSDITPIKIIEFIENDKTKTFEIKKNDFITIKPISLLYQTMYN